MTLLLAALALQTAAPAASTVPADWRIRPLTAGVWTWRSSPQASEALFSDSLGIQLIIRCTRATRQVSFSRTGAAPTAPIRIATTSSQRQLPPGQMVLSSDPLLDAIAFSRGRLLVDAAATMPLVVRAAPEPARAIEDCRS